MPIYLAFDVYGTLIDTAGVAVALQGVVGDRAADFARQWREKQLEYSFRRALMRDYVPFGECIAQAFDYTCAGFGVAPAPNERADLLALYRRLPAFPDAEAGLAALAGLPLRCFAFSNGHPDDLRSLLSSSGLIDHFEGIVSLFDVRTYKPDPAAYAHFHRAAQTGGAETWLISSNPFDVIGAVAAGMRALWLRRSPSMQFDPWEHQPTATVATLVEAAAFFRRHCLAGV